MTKKSALADNEDAGSTPEYTATGIIFSLSSGNFLTSIFCPSRIS